jgi:small subunit ribosomal protein S18
LSNEENQNNQQRSSGARGQRARRTQRRRFIPRRKVCAFCTDKIDVIDYKRPEILRRFLTDRGKIRPRRRTGTCAKHQRRLAVAIKRARHLALLPYVAEHLRRYG